MAYNEFAYFYDEFNGEADYEALYDPHQKRAGTPTASMTASSQTWAAGQES